jgi:hypothetical protein
VRCQHDHSDNRSSRQLFKIDQIHPLDSLMSQNFFLDHRMDGEFGANFLG